MLRIHHSQFILASVLLTASAIFTPLMPGAAYDGGPSTLQSPPVDTATAYILRLTADDYTLYTDPVYRFSFPYPKSFAVSTFPAGAGELVLFHHPQLPLWFQILVDSGETVPSALMPMCLAAGLVPERGELIDSFLNDGTPVLRVSPRAPWVDAPRQAWFIHAGSLYQVTMYASNSEWVDAWIRGLLNQWTFE